MDSPGAGLRIGFVPGVTLTKWRRVWAERFPRLPLGVVEVAQAAQRAVLDQGQVDLCFVRLPLDRDGLHLIPLYAEVPVVVVPKDHPLSLFEEVSLADLSEETFVAGVDAGVAVDLVAGGAGVLLVPQSIARSHGRRDLVYRPVADAPPTQIGLAWLVDPPSALIDDFVGIVRGRTVNSSRTPQPPVAAPSPARAPTTRRRPDRRPSRRPRRP